jgi:hypothetical protein
MAHDGGQRPGGSSNAKPSLNDFGGTNHSTLTFSLPEDFGFSPQVIVSGAQGEGLPKLNGVYDLCPDATHKRFPKYQHQSADAIIYCGHGLEPRKWAWKLNCRNRTDSYIYISPSFGSNQAEKVLAGEGGESAAWTHIYLPSLLLSKERSSMKITTAAITTTTMPTPPVGGSLDF